MSWFDTSSFASLAKTALKEAQKTIDKALDIKDEEQRSGTVLPQDSTSSSEVFDTWEMDKDKPVEESKSVSDQSQSTSIWGSFTGSFFENPKDIMTAVTNKTAEAFKGSIESLDGQTVLKSSKSLPESLSVKDENVQSLNSGVQSVSDLDSASIISKSESIEEYTGQASISHNISGNQNNSTKLCEQKNDIYTSAKSTEAKKPHDSDISETNKKYDVVLRLNENLSNTITNTSHSVHRLSVLSIESDKRSSESVEILSMQSDTNTDCTTSPDSDMHSLSISMGQKIHSESVEVIPDSLTSPSSVEILTDWKSDESPHASPLEERPFETSTTPISGQSIEVAALIESSIDGDVKSSTSTLVGSIPITASRTSLTTSRNKDASGEGEDIDEASLADDSYASGSESTMLTVLEPAKDEQSICKSAESLDYPLDQSLDSLKDRSLTNLQLSIEAITCQPHSSTSPFDRLISSTIEPSDCKSQIEGLERSSTSEQYAMLTDSSCEETLIESSSDDNNAASTFGTVKQPLTSSSYVKCMLAEAMADKSELENEKDSSVSARDNSPISSESRSDLVKIGSDQTSGHTSGDEIETTTSSDIEIISRYSPNGDSSSTQSRQSPAKLPCSSKTTDLLTRTLKTRGHSRELSEISVGSDDASLEVERLLRRVREMTELLEARESKLIEVSRANMELHEINSSLKKQLDSFEKNAEHSQDISQLTDDYTQRLSALERKFQQAIRERDSLRKSLEITKQEAASRLSANEMSSINAEKDEMIRELREEGEKLSKQQLTHSNIIKKLRAKEKESDALIKSQSEQLEEKTTELERLKRSLYAKEEVERSQIEAVHTLTAKCKKQEKDILILNENLDHVTNKMEAYKRSFEAAKSDLLETKEKLKEKEEHLKLALENADESNERELQIVELKKKIREMEEENVKTEELHRQEKQEILRRLEGAESRSEDMAESLAQTTRPLLRQIEQLQSSLTHKTNLYMKQEESMTERINELEVKLENIMETNRSLSEECTNLKSKCSVLETKLNSKEIERRKLEETIEGIKKESDQLAEENKVHKQAMKMLEDAHAVEIKELKREVSSLENKLSVEKAATDAEKRKVAAIEYNASVEELRFSPTLSIGRDSVCSTSSVWPTVNDSVFESGSGRFSNVYDSYRTGSNSTSMLENFQAQLKQREGEVHQLQWDLSRRTTERDALSTELSKLSLQVENLQQKVVDLDRIKENLKDVQTKYDALLQMYGEKVEENEELRLDLEDVKDMYKTQIDQLLKRDL
ncbi:TATA element modulatory factor isoform X2 [Trichogramma pretiosum]|uniref:TATA element modulatory factor isoform X2 n=1 Tax=Trichogramma pretiosum TaxID=7493 RepID=UPI000C718CEB|nr:TATA element modulatory factor isoform X2 [Trichogramma pretiosum]